MLPRFEIVHRVRPVDLVAHTGPVLTSHGDLTAPLPVVAPYVAVEATVHGPSRLTLRAGSTVATGVLARDRAWLEVDGHRHRSRRHSRVDESVEGMALLLTGSQVTLVTRHARHWIGRALVDLRDPRTGGAPVWDEAWLDDLRVETQGASRVRAGTSGQVGLRDLRFVTTRAGEPWPLPDGRLLLTATHAGPGGFGTGRTGVWSIDPDTLALEHRADLWFRRPDRPGVFGDHATHLVRDGAGWLVATSTWGDFDRTPGRLHLTLAETGADLTRGQHVLDTRELALPREDRSVAVWDPHLVHTGQEWLVGHVSASRFFRFHPVLAAGPSLDALSLRASDPRRTATEGTTLLRHGEAWRVVASDGRDSRRGQRARFPVFDLDLRQIGTLDAPYPTNLPWPNLVRRPDGSWLMVTFNGRAWGSGVLPYGTHGQVVCLRTEPDDSDSAAR